MMDKNNNSGLLPVGTLLAGGKYRIERYIASGGFGNTYYAINTAFDEPVVIKELFIKGICGRTVDTSEVSVSLTENRVTFEDHRDKFRKEARRLRRLNNPHIVQVHDLFDENGTSYYEMDYVDGESLSARLARTGVPLSEAEATDVLMGMLQALKAVHEQGIWHLDVKPGNILVNKEGVPMLIDFGASKQLHSTTHNSVSMASGMAYTMGYAPTEQMEQKPEKFGPWTDLYSLGATLYRIMTRNKIPSPSDIIENVDEALKFPEGVSREMRDLVVWMMEPLRTMRPQSVDEVLERIEQNRYRAEAEQQSAAYYAPSTGGAAAGNYDEYFDDEEELEAIIVDDDDDELPGQLAVEGLDYGLYGSGTMQPYEEEPAEEPVEEEPAEEPVEEPIEEEPIEEEPVEEEPAEEEPIEEEPAEEEPIEEEPIEEEPVEEEPIEEEPIEEELIEEEPVEE
ncbi:MAG: serine/threonine protein kinase, partial [Muribaculaceae bacterium]|nr:serine/threonine protein kinase [Muribaculaceae bacterium]